MIIFLTVIVKADCLHQVYRNLPFQQLCVLLQQRTVNPGQILVTDLFIEPFQNRILVYIFHFHIGNRQRQIGSYILQTFLHFFQISCKKKKIPEIIRRPVNVLISDILVYRLFNGASLYQRLHLLLYAAVSAFHQLPDDTVR